MRKIFIENQNKLSHIEVIKNILKKINFTFHKDSLNILKTRLHQIQNRLFKFILMKMDLQRLYKNFINIEPTSDKLINFLFELQNKTKKIDCYIRLSNPDILKKINSQINRANIKIYDNLDFSELRILHQSRNFDFLSWCNISCNCSLNVKQIDIIDKSYNYTRWTEHFRNYNYLYREKFDILANKILEKL